ncbi:MAG: UDP-N-acetylglucosamine diphosphorylase/glucosamine-1-phosphate N-acetyltransferase [Dehalococcoidia bacterium]|nr:UDP-N-acetylglucosamine diphosphorylase/glucosamine-1-phosphate N-acetyltransferase [Dehalococcoidia bacterium]
MAVSGWAALVLAAGRGTRMRSSRHKVLHELCGAPMASHVVAAAAEAGVETIAMVVGYQAQAVREALGDGLLYVEQRQQRGTGHAVLQAKAALGRRAKHLLVMNGDVPLVRPETVRALMQAHADGNAAVTMLTVSGGAVEGLGRVRRDGHGRVSAVVEEAALTAGERTITEVNAGVYCFDAAWLWPALAKLRPSVTGEIYLTGLVRLAYGDRCPAVTVQARDASEGLGVDTRLRLAEAEQVLRGRIRRRWMLEGVTLHDPATIYIDAGVEIGQDTVVHPNTFLLGTSRIGEACEIGPGTVLRNSTLGKGCRVVASVIEDSTLEDGVDAGPFSHLRQGAYLEAGVHIGNYVEIKQSRMGKGAKSGHFSYIGDATVGRRANIGAGTITCNFDGVHKHQTVIGDDALIGSDTMLVAPVKVGRGAKTGAGAVVIRDVPAGATVVGVPARPVSSSGRPGQGRPVSSSTSTKSGPGRKKGTDR